MKVGNKVKIQKLARGEILEMSGRDWQYLDMGTGYEWEGVSCLPATGKGHGDQ